MSFLQLVFWLDKTFEGNNSILENMSFWLISQHLSVHRRKVTWWREHTWWRRVCMAKGVCMVKGMCMVKGVCMAKRGVHGKGACIAKGGTCMAREACMVGEMATAVGSTHPTWMHSVSNRIEILGNYGFVALTNTFLPFGAWCTCFSDWHWIGIIRQGEIPGIALAHVSHDERHTHGLDRYVGFIPKKIQWHIHTGMWSLVNWWREGSYEALYERVMNINEDGCRPWGMASALMVISAYGMSQHPPFSLKEEALPACKETITWKI